MEKITSEKKIPISFHAHPFIFKSGNNTFEKPDSKGVKRRYLAGISSGLKLDGHSERMTERCIKSFMDQANSGDILLFPDIHGIRASKDVGILYYADIIKSGKNFGDWYTEYRLFDEDDDIDKESLETGKKIWKQTRGDHPYRTPRQKGFSIEGFVPEGSILSAQKDSNGNIGKRVIDEVLLDGVVVVPRPAYQDSIANAIYKALGEVNPFKEEKIKKAIQTKLQDRIKGHEIVKAYTEKRFDLIDALDESVNEVMNYREDSTKKDQVRLLFEEFSEMMVDLIFQSKEFFKEKDNNDSESENPYVIDSKSSQGEDKKNVQNGQIVEVKKIETYDTSKREVIKVLLNKIKIGG